MGTRAMFVVKGIEGVTKYYYKSQDSYPSGIIGLIALYALLGTTQAFKYCDEEVSEEMANGANGVLTCVILDYIYTLDDKGITVQEWDSSTPTGEPIKYKTIGTMSLKDFVKDNFVKDNLE